MRELPEALAPLAAYRQFILYKVGPDPDRPGKLKKVPISPHTCRTFPASEEAAESPADNWQKNPNDWTDASTACTVATALGPEYGVGFLFTEGDPFYFLDIDSALDDAGTAWAPWSLELCQRLAGAAIEVSASGTGLHIFGTGRPTLPSNERRKKSRCNRVELYTERRFAALTGTGAQGSAAQPADQAQLDAIVQQYLQQDGAGAASQDWTTEPDSAWTVLTDDEIIERALRATSGAAVFGGRATFRDLWEGNADALARSYPDSDGTRDFDSSNADAALAQHLAFWAGRNCETIQRLMWQSALAREKWHREDYLPRTILGAVARQSSVYSLTSAADAHPQGLRGSDPQIALAAPIRAEKFSQAAELPADDIQLLANQQDAGFWIDNRDRAPAELVAMLRPVESAPAAETRTCQRQPELVHGYQYLGATQQLDYFGGCTYIADVERILTPAGDLLKQSQFKAVYGGYVFQLDETGRKTTRNAWEAFTESQLIRFPKVQGMCFRPGRAFGEIIHEEGRHYVNTYQPLGCERVAGDVTPFLQHMEKLLPDSGDRQIVLSYLAGIVQYPGVKFQWAPVIQGVEGNGKTFLYEALSYVVGTRYSHVPDAESLKDKFNGWVENKLLICVEEIHVRGRLELADKLKPLVTNRRIPVEFKGVDQRTGDNFANFLMFSNHKDAVLKTRNDRRYSVFFTAQQTMDDLARDGMDGSYFPDLYAWLRADGHRAIAHYLQTYQIPAHLDPSNALHRAPETRSTEAAVAASEGPAEQEIREAIAEERPGFSGGWISSRALDAFMRERNIKISQNKRRELVQSLGYDWHPHLPDGRTNDTVMQEDNKKIRLYIRAGHISQNLTNGGDIIRAYLKAQGYAVQAPVVAAPPKPG